MRRLARGITTLLPGPRPSGAAIALWGVAAGIVAVGMWVILNGPMGDFRTVKLTGYDRNDRAEIERLVEDAVRRGNVLSIPDQEVLVAARRSPWIDDIAFRRSFPLTLEVAVLPARPVAVAVPPKGRSVLVSGRGLILGPAGKNPKLPRIRLPGAAPAPGERLPRASRAGLRFIRVAEGTDVYPRLRGLRLRGGELIGHLVEGPELIIGPPEQLRAKALSLNAVYGHLAPAERREAAYVDVSWPERPAVGSPVSAASDQIADATPIAAGTEPADAAGGADPVSDSAPSPNPAPAPEPTVPPEPAPAETPRAPAPAPVPEAIAPALPGGLEGGSAPPLP